MDNLALFDGAPVRTEDFALGYDPISRKNFDNAEIDAVTEVLETGRLSGFSAGASKDFYGGPKVKEFEEAWADYFNVEHAVAVNSWTSGLNACVAAADLDPGDEVIVPPLTMSASASAVLTNNAVPKFADVDSQTANLDPDSVREHITSRTEAIMLVHLFGYPAKMDEFQSIANEYDLTLIEDAAQAIGAEYDGEYVGTIGDIGGFSLNVHKHIQTGEGGVITTDDDELAQRARLVRNHAEAVVGQVEGSYLGELDFKADHMIGQNYRMTDLTAAVGIEQLQKLPDLLNKRVNLSNRLRSLLENVDIVNIPPVREDSTHSYYNFPMLYNREVGGVKLDLFIEALEAEGVPVSKYVRPLHKLPVYQEGNVHSNGIVHDGEVKGAQQVKYPENICPVANELYQERLIVSYAIIPENSRDDIRDIATAIKKIEQNTDSLRKYAEDDTNAEKK